MHHLPQVDMLLQAVSSYAGQLWAYKGLAVLGDSRQRAIGAREHWLCCQKLQLPPAIAAANDPRLQAISGSPLR
jgi:hypothetical protein